MSVISLYDVLKANKGLPVGEPIACHWGRKLGGGAAGYDELTGTPPLTFTANGRNLINYRIYGASGGVGEQTAQIFDISKVDNGDIVTHSGDTIRINGGGYWYDLLSFTAGISAQMVVSKSIFLEAGTYTIKIGEVVRTSGTGSVNGIVIFSTDGSDTSSLVGQYNISNSQKTFTTPTDGYISLRISAGNPTIQGIVIVKGSTAPAQYIPFGYQINAEVGDSVTTTDIPIYIGDTPLAQGEYADYGEQKVYKDISGVLTPVDPTDAIPDLPTIDGVTIIDFDNEPKPSEMYIKYPK